jgi:hypothetical protein
MTIGVAGTLVTFLNPTEREAAVATAAALTAAVIAASAALFAMLEAMDVGMKKRLGVKCDAESHSDYKKSAVVLPVGGVLVSLVCSWCNCTSSYFPRKGVICSSLA